MNIHLKKGILLIFIFCIRSILIAQVFVPADPYNLLQIEKNIFFENKMIGIPIFRPVLNPIKTNNHWSLKMRSEVFYNSGAPNLENMSDRWVGKGLGFFSSLNVSFQNKFIALSAEPFYYVNQNRNYEEPDRLPQFSRLNDSRPHEKSPYTHSGFRDLQLYLKLKGVGIGYSNANMWWGSGIHSSIMMTNNTSGFRHLFLGTIEEKRFNNIGINTRYIFSHFDKKSLYRPYFSAFALSFAYYSDNIYTIGVTKTALTGGTHRSADELKWQEAVLAVLYSGIIPDNWTRAEYLDNWSHDDHAAAGYITIDILESSLKLYFEVGRNDIAGSALQLLVYPEHSIATIIGLRKYGLFNREQLFFSMEYTSLILPRLSHRIPPGDWYSKKVYDYSSYNGRRWAAHSGSDSDDLLISFGWLDDTFSILPSINYERHGLRLPTSLPNSNLVNDELRDIWTETKVEFRVDLRYKYHMYSLNLFFEKEFLYNLESKGKTRTGNVFWIGIEREFDKNYFKNIRKK